MTQPQQPGPASAGALAAAISAAVVAVVVGTHDAVGPALATVLGIGTGFAGAMLVYLLNRIPPPPPPPPPVPTQQNPA